MIQTIRHYLLALLDKLFSPVSPSTPSKPLRVHDTYKFTKGDCEYILAAKKAHDKENSSIARQVDRKTYSDLTYELNAVLGLNKSKSSYARIWNGEKLPEDFPTTPKEV